MANHGRRRRRSYPKLGEPPGTIIHIGRGHGGPVALQRFTYNAEKLEEKHAAACEEILEGLPADAVTWINLDGVHHTEAVERIGKRFGVHLLAMEDIANTAGRPKCDDYRDKLFLVTKMLMWDDAHDCVRSEQVCFVLGKNFLLTFQEDPGDVFDTIRNRLRTGKGRMRTGGADYLLYSLLDAIVDFYFVILEKLGDRIEDLEEVQITNPSPETLRGIRELKRQIRTVRRALWPMRDVVGALERGKNTLLTEETGLYMRDLYDHAVQIIETVETYRDQLSGILDIYISSISNKTNEVMKVLTIIATIFIPLTFITGLYGMNFQGGDADRPLNMPELYWPYGYLFCLGLMAAVTIGMLIYFRRKKWM
jgi:magnesium transporter